MVNGFVPVYNGNPYPLPRKKEKTRDFYARFFYNKLFNNFIARYQIDFPKTINSTAFITLLASQGWLILSPDSEGNARAWNGYLTDLDMYGFPKLLGLVPIYRGANNEEIQKDVYKTVIADKGGVLVRLTPNAESIVSLISAYAVQMANIAIDIDVNLQNCKLARIFFADDGDQAQQIRKLVDDISSGSLAVIEDKGVLGNLLSGEKAKIPVYSTPSDYFCDKLIADQRQVYNEFLSSIGINVSAANIAKLERNTNEEVHANDEEVFLNASFYIDTIKEDIDKFNRLFNTNLSIEYKKEKEEKDERLDVVDQSSGMST